VPLNPDSVGLSGVLVILFVLLASGRIVVWPVVREMQKRIDLLEKRLDTRDRQLSIVLTESMTVVSPVLRAMRDAVQAEPEEGD
jgi:hypothetical protein